MILEKIIQTIKKEPEYKFSSSITASEIIQIIWDRVVQILRGLTLKPFVKSKGFLFLGSNTKIKFKRQLTTGKNVIIDDNVFINAYSENGIYLGDNVTITRDSILVASGVIRRKGVGIKIGSNTGINARAYLGGQGGISIGDYVIIGPDVKIFSENHIYSDISTPIKFQGESRKGVIIEDNCWIGAGSIILDGVHLGKGCVVAAGAVVTKSFSDNSIIGGVPAKLLKNRI
jgi:acetyltransferase-like isoleucine patch superfamily enzyme